MFLRRLVWDVAAASLAIALMCASAHAYPPTDLKKIKTHHGSSTLGARYCPFAHWLCLPTIGPGPANLAELASGYGNSKGDITNDPLRPGGLALHLKFEDMPDFPADSSYQGNDTLLAVSDTVAALLGAEHLVLAPGRFPYSSATSLYGDLYLSARVTLPPAPFQFGRHDYATGQTPIAVVVSELNRDGIPDLVTADVNGNTVSVLLGNGDDTFAAPLHFATASRPYGVAVADLNADGKLDLAVACELAPGAVSVLLGNGDGTFAPRTDFGAGGNAHAIGVGDFTGDGKPDLVVAHYYASTISLLAGDGTGVFGAPTDFAAGDGSGSLAVADVDTDGISDVVTANGSAGTFSVMLCNGAGGFSRTDIPAGANPYGPAIGDFNGDGFFDLATPHYYSGTVSVLLGNGSGGFASPDDFTTAAGPGAIAAGDLNGDGKCDLVTASQVSGGPNFVSVILGDGTGGFGGHVEFPVGDYPIALALGDLTGDLRLEVVTASHLESKVSVLLNGDVVVGAPPAPSAPRFRLESVAPNPGRGSVRIAFHLPSSEVVRLSVLDPLGRVVATLANGEFPAGRSELTWNAMGRVGVMPAGVYWARCEVGGRTLSRRFVVSR